MKLNTYFYYKYTNVIKAYAKSYNRSQKGQSSFIVNKVESILKRMEESRDKNVRPNTLTYSVIIDLYAKVGNATKAIELLDRMELMYNEGNDKVRPNEVTYNACLNSLAKSEIVDAL